MLSWTIDIYTRVNNELVEGVLNLFLIENSGYIWVEITSPYDGVSIASKIRNDGSVYFQGEWIVYNDTDSEIIITSMLVYLYLQCMRFDDNRDEIVQLYRTYIDSSEYEPIAIQESMKKELQSKLLELKENMDMDNPHDSHWSEYDELWMKYDAVFDIPPVPIVDQIRETFNIEGSREFVILLIRKFIDEYCDWT